jgi:hypothetical protein
MQIRIVIRWSPGAIADYRHTARKVIDRLCCLIAGHKDEVTLGDHRLALHCARCGRTSTGWQLDERWPV